MDEKTHPERVRACSASELAVDDAASFSSYRVGTFRHTFHEHPLLRMSALEQLAVQLMPLNQCRFVRPGITQSSSFAHSDRHPEGRSIAEVFRRIEEPGSWLALYNVEAVPRYKALIGEILDLVRPMVEREQGKIFMETGFIFISAPPSVTPFHIDRENNFWLQLHGRKVMSVWPHTDRLTVPAEAVEDYIVAHSMRGVKLKEESRVRSREFDVGPGDGVYFPSTSPHATRTDRDWCRAGDGVSVSFGVNFYTESTRRVARVHQVNRLLRKGLGMTPAYPGVSPTSDAIKEPVGRSLVVARQLAKKVLGPLLGRPVAPTPPGAK